MKILSLLALSFLSFSTVHAAPAEQAGQSIYDVKVKSLQGDPVSLSQYKGKVLLIVNTASHCGFTPQYEGLEAIYKKYNAQGFEILGFPSNDFGGQEPGTPKEIKNFCETKYKVTFPLFEKNPVSGKDKQPLYVWLLANDPDQSRVFSEVKWNFEKFLISADGKELDRFRSNTKPDSDEVTKAIEKALKK